VIDKNKMRDYLNLEKPDLIASTYFFATGSAIQLREAGELTKDVPLVWIHTDYDPSRFFYKLAKKADVTFAPSQEIADAWTKKGLDPKKVIVTGLMVSEDVLLEMSETEKNEYLLSKGLKLDSPVIVIAGGGEGAVDYEKIIQSIADANKQPLQIVVLAGKNEEKRKALEALKLRSDISLKVEGFIPNIEVIKYAKSAAVSIVKPGAFSATEFTGSRAKSVFINFIGSQEGQNARYFERGGMALVTNDQNEVGEKVALILGNPEVAQKIYESTLKMKDNLHGERATDFISSAVSGAQTKKVSWDLPRCSAWMSFKNFLLSEF
jgi:UDP-N-acetylglucosamine:LPS N-acetylglucosamine transferase